MKKFEELTMTNKIDITTFFHEFSFKDSVLENIGYEFYNNQIVITINWFDHSWSSSEKDDQRILVNFVFDGAKEIVINPQLFTLDSNKILEVEYEQSTNDLDKIIFVFCASEGSVELSFKAKSVECEPLNPYINLITKNAKN